MIAYSQINPRWAKQKLGTSSHTIGSSGCFITCLAMVYDGTIRDPKGVVRPAHPGILDWLFTVRKLYANRCQVVQSRMCSFLGLKDRGKTTRRPNYACIAETDHYARRGVPQHFFVWFPNNTIYDPLDGFTPEWKPRRKKNPYRIKSYRLITK